MFVECPSEFRGPAVDSTGKVLNGDALLQEVAFRWRGDLVQSETPNADICRDTMGFA